MGGKTTLDTTLLTDDERRAKLESLLGHRFIERGQIMLPKTQDYNSLSSDAGLQQLAYEMCRWLGMKPNGLQVKYIDERLTSGFTVDTKQKLIKLDQLYAAHPYTGAALLVLAVVAYFVEHYDHAKADRMLVEFSTIETGLGLWLVNALQPKISWRQRIYHILDSAWFHAEGIQLELYQPKQYVELVTKYAHDNRIAPETYIPHVIQRCAHLLPQFLKNQVPLHLPESDVILRHKKTANLLWVKMLLVAMIIASGVTLGIYALVSHDPTNTAVNHEQLQKITNLKNSHESCLRDASDQQSTYDPNDLFLNRQIDATKARCESLRNEYNYALDTYQNIK